MEDIFSQFGDIFGSAFGGGFGGFGGQRQRVVRGSNLRVRVSLTLEEISKGVDKKIKVKRRVKAPGSTFKTCPTCNGNGQVTRVTSTILGRMQTSTTCESCGGAGQTLDNRPKGADNHGLMIKEETVNIPIPAGVVDEMQLKVSGKGNEAPGNGVNGDLLVVINEIPHQKLQREGDNLHYELYVSMPDAILGTGKEINTVTGKVRIKIDPGMQSGKILRLRGKGIVDVREKNKMNIMYLNFFIITYHDFIKFFFIFNYTTNRINRSI